MHHISECPFCARPLSEASFSRDHIFVDSLGGHQTVPACRECNSTIGEQVEGRLLRPGTMLNFLRQAHGHGNAFRATVNAGRDEVDVDIARGTVRFARPVTTAEADGTRTYTYRGSPDHVRQLLRQQRSLSTAEIEDLVDGAAPESLDDWVETTITHDLAVAARLVAKVALAGGAYAGGDEFVRSDFAAELRDVLWVRTPALPAMPEEAFPVLDGVIGAALAEHGMEPLESLLPPPGASQLAVLPVPRDSYGAATAVFVDLMGVNPVGGLRLAATPPLAPRAGLLVRDAPGRALVRSRDAELARTIADTPPPCAR